MSDFLLPDLGEGLTEAELVRWLVAEGEVIAVDQAVAEVETAKAVVEVPSPYGGVVRTLHGAEGDVLAVGSPLISVDEVSDNETQTLAAETSASNNLVPDLTAAAYRAEEQAGSGNVLIGYGTKAPGSSARRLKRKASSAPTLNHETTPHGNSAPNNSGHDDDTQAKATSPGRMQRSPLVISPLVRKLAHDGGVDVAQLEGSGPSGLVLRKDVEAAIAARTSKEAASAPDSADWRGTRDPRSGLDVVSRTALTGMRKAVAAAMTRSRSDIPDATVWVDADVSNLVRLRAELKAAGASVPSLLSYIARFTVAGLVKFPELNSRIDGDAILAVHGVNLGLAMQTERGLVVPSVKNAHDLSTEALDREIRTLVESARAGRSTPDELSRGTFTLNNYGVFGVDGSAAIINYPEAAILGVGRIIQRPWVVAGELAVREVCELTLTFDHRVCDGGVAGGFLRFIADSLENPLSAISSM